MFSLQKEASKLGHKFDRAELNHDKYKVVSGICTNILGELIEVHTPKMDITRDSYWGIIYERCHCNSSVRCLKFI